jgi:hypothetical protein
MPLLHLLGWQAEWRDLVFIGKTEDSSNRASKRRLLGMTFIHFGTSSLVPL